MKGMHSQVIEYASDLREFWKRGYGHDINSKASCNLFHDVFNRLNRAARENRRVNFQIHPHLVQICVQRNLNMKVHREIDGSQSLDGSILDLTGFICMSFSHVCFEGAR